ncbi:MAG: hypothetical protein AAGA31_20170, partial [Bacteroidota bacterium]
MPNKEFEKALREQLYDHPSPIDTEATWKAVEASLGKKERRGGFLWWIPGLLLAVLAGGSVWAGLSRQQDTRDQEVVTTEAVKERTVLATPKIDPITAEKPISASSSSSSSSSEGLRSFSGKEVNTAKPKLPKTPTKKLVSSPPIASLAKKATSPTVFPEEGIDPVEQQLRKVTAQPLLPTIALTPLPELFYDPTTSPFAKLKGPTDCPVFVRTKDAGWELATRGTYSKIQRELTATSEMDTGQLSRNLRVEKPLEALSFEVLLGYRSANNFTLRTGIGLTRLNSVAIFSQDRLEEGRVDGVTEIIINAAGDTTLIFGEVDGFTRTRAYYEYYNNFTTIDLPILVGKTFTRDRWSLALEAGPVFNLRSRGSAR